FCARTTAQPTAVCDCVDQYCGGELAGGGGSAGVIGTLGSDPFAHYWGFSTARRSRGDSRRSAVCTATTAYRSGLGIHDLWDTRARRRTNPPGTGLYASR